MLDIPPATPDAVVLLTTNILPLSHRFRQLQLNFYIKLRNATDTLASKILHHIIAAPRHIRQYSNAPESYDMSIKGILQYYGSSFQHALFDTENHLSNELYRSLISCKIQQTATLQLLHQLGQYHHCTQLIQSLTNIHDIDILLENATQSDFTQRIDTFLHDISFHPFYIPFINKEYLPSEIFNNRHYIWHSLLWHYSSTTATDTCPKCLEQHDNMLLHWLFECDKYSSIRDFIFNEMLQLQNNSNLYNTHSLFEFLNNWLHNNEVHFDYDILNDILLTCMSPSITTNDLTFDNHTCTTLRSLLINLAAFTLPSFTSLLHPINWSQTEHGNIIDLQDCLQHKRINLERSRNGTLSLTTTMNHSQAHQTQFPIFASARIRKQQPELQAIATRYIDNLVTEFSDDIILWSDASVRKFYQHAGVATLVSLGNHNIHNKAIRLQTQDIALAELCGILLNLYWLSTNIATVPIAHIFCDNQYAIKACLQLCHAHTKHILVIQKILQIKQCLSDRVAIQFHWIPSHTNNIRHSQVDTKARNCILDQFTQLVDVPSLLYMHTDASASGGILSH